MLLGPDTPLFLQMEVEAGETSALIRRARARGARIILNLAPAAPMPRDVLGLLDIMVVHETEAAFLAFLRGASAVALHKNLACTVIRTLGGAGSEYAGKDGAFRVPAYPVTVCATTGRGGLVHWRFGREPRSWPVHCRRFGPCQCCCRALLARLGTQNSLLTGAETDRPLGADTEGGCYQFYRSGRSRHTLPLDISFHSRPS